MPLLRKPPLRSKSQTRARRRARFILGGIGGGALIAAFVFFAWLANRDEFLIATITVRGVSSATEKKILDSVQASLSGNYFFLFPKKNGILYPREVVADTLLDTISELASISVVARRPFTTLTIEGIERQGAYLWCKGDDEEEEEESNHCYSVDKEGIVFEETLLSPDRVPLFSSAPVVVWQGALASSARASNRAPHPLGKRVLPRAEFEKATAFIHSLNTLHFQTQSVHLQESGDWEFTLEGGARILTRRGGDFTKVFENFSTAISSGELKDISPVKFSTSLDYVDLRFDRRVFYKER